MRIHLFTGLAECLLQMLNRRLLLQLQFGTSDIKEQVDG